MGLTKGNGCLAASKGILLFKFMVDFITINSQEQTTWKGVKETAGHLNSLHSELLVRFL